MPYCAPTEQPTAASTAVMMTACATGRAITYRARNATGRSAYRQALSMQLSNPQPTTRHRIMERDTQQQVSMELAQNGGIRWAHPLAFWNSDDGGSIECYGYCRAWRGICAIDARCPSPSRLPC